MLIQMTSVVNLSEVIAVAFLMAKHTEKDIERWCGVMIRQLNLKLKDGVEPSALLKYGFLPKYDENTGEIKEYIKKIHIHGEDINEQHFTFVLYTKHIEGGIFRRTFHYEAWMTGFNWDCLCKKEALQLFYDLIVDGVVEPAEKKNDFKE